MSKSKSINIFLIDGETTGRIKSTMQNWTGVAYKIPRIKLESCKNGDHDIVKHLKQSGIYFLLGEDQDGSPIIYIGQAGVRKNGQGLLNRLLEHKKNDREAYFSEWNEAICFSTQNDIFGPTEISYLENRFTNLANNSRRYLVRNGNEPTLGNITEEKESELKEFLEYACLITGVMGYKVFEPIIANRDEAIEKKDDNPIFEFKSQKLKAKGMLTNEGFVVLKGSQISDTLTPSAREKTNMLRKQCENKVDDNYILTDDILFSSVSAAACFVGGASLNGNTMWVTEDKKTPKDF